MTDNVSSGTLTHTQSINLRACRNYLEQIVTGQRRPDVVVGADVFTQLVGAADQQPLSTALYQLAPDQWRPVMTPAVRTTCRRQPVLHSGISIHYHHHHRSRRRRYYYCISR